MQLEINAFEDAYYLLKAKTKELDDKVTVEIDKRKTVDELQELVDLLPRGYPGVRRVFEKIYRLESK